MSNSKQFLQLILALVFLALAFRIINAETVSLSVSPIDGIHVTAEGSHPPPPQAQAGR